MNTRSRLAALTAVAGLLAVPLALMTSASPAAAQSRVDVGNDRDGTATADLTYRTSMTVRGEGFQVVPNGFGGVYVLFGWVDDPGGGSWRPSQGGLTGQDYQYVPDAESEADNQGFLRFVAFPGGSTAGEAAAVLGDDGSFEVDLTVPGPVFQSVDRDGAVAEVDCREVTCGVITLGAHGVKNARNETFTPVSFGDVYGGEAPPEAVVTTEPAPQTPGGPTEEPVPAPGGPGAPGAGDTAAEDVAAAGPPAVDVDRATAVAGRAMTFTATGFAPGEQVVAGLDDGTAAVGPFTAGTAGELAGVISLPADLAVGTHELRLTGAVSGASVLQRFPVAANEPPDGALPADVAADGAADGADDGVSTAAATDGDAGAPPGGLFLGLAIVLALAAAIGYVLTALRGRQATR